MKTTLLLLLISIGMFGQNRYYMINFDYNYQFEQEYCTISFLMEVERVMEANSSECVTLNDTIAITRFFDKNYIYRKIDEDCECPDMPRNIKNHILDLKSAKEYIELCESDSTPNWIKVIYY